MAKLISHTNFQDLKENPPMTHPKQSDLKKESELKELVMLLTKHRNYKNHTRINNSPNQSTNER